MSLRGFHIVFVTICTLLFGFMAVWDFLLAPENAAGVLGIAVVGIAGLLLMPIYGVYFLRKATKMKL